MDGSPPDVVTPPVEGDTADRDLNGEPAAAAQGPDPVPDPARRRPNWEPRLVAGVCATVVVAVAAWALSPSDTTDAPRKVGTAGAAADAAAASDGAATPAPSGSSATVPAETLPALSFDDTSARAACARLERAAIEQALGGPVGEPLPQWPACHWSVGEDAFFALAWDEARPWSVLAASVSSIEGDGVSGVGEAAFFGANKSLYFGTASGSGWVTFQRAGEWTDDHRDALVTLARTALAAERPDPVPVFPAASRCAPGCDRKATEPRRLWIGGDSLSAGPAWALGNLARAAGFEVSTEQQVATGLARPDFFDWPRHLQAIMAYTDPDIVVFMAGTNDGQGLYGDGPPVPYDSADWDAEYARRVGALMDVLTANGRRLVWVGEPPMRDADLSDRMARINAVLSGEARRRDSVTYLDTWTLLAPPGAPGLYTDRLLFSEGTKAVRLPDGLHLNVDGSKLLANAIVENLRAGGWYPPSS